jgi:hypothetical protein
LRLLARIHQQPLSGRNLHAIARDATQMAAMGAATIRPAISPTGCPAITRSPRRHSVRQVPAQGDMANRSRVTPPSARGPPLRCAAGRSRSTSPMCAPHWVSMARWQLRPGA